MSRQTADIICRALIMIVVALRKEHKLPEYHGITLHIGDTIAGFAERGTISETE